MKEIPKLTENKTDDYYMDKKKIPKSILKK